MYKSLNDAPMFADRGEGGPQIEIWYSTDEFFLDGSMGASWLADHEKLPDLSHLGKTHSLLGTIAEPEAGNRYELLEQLFINLQGEVWSPNGEARDLIKSLGNVWHISMSVGDIIRLRGEYYMVDRAGFANLTAGAES